MVNIVKSIGVTLIVELTDGSQGRVKQTLRETRPLRTFDFGKRAIKVFKCDGKVTFTIPFQDIYPFIKGDLPHHLERSCKGDLSITFTIP